MDVRPRKLLLVDDSEFSLNLVAGVLNDAGYEVRTSTGVANLGAVLDGWRPDLILADVEMPGMSGLQLCRHLKSLDETAQVPVVLFSARKHAELEDLARECEAAGFLRKSSVQLLPRDLELLIARAGI